MTTTTTRTTTSKITTTTTRKTARGNEVIQAAPTVRTVSVYANDCNCLFAYSPDAHQYPNRLGVEFHQLPDSPPKALHFIPDPEEGTVTVTPLKPSQHEAFYLADALRYEDLKDGTTAWFNVELADGSFLFD